MGFSQDMNYSVTANTIPVEAMGRYEVISNEPISYSVNGSFSITRYIVPAASTTNIPNISANKTNSPGVWSNSQLNPGKILNSASFDIEILQRVPDAAIQTVLTSNDVNLIETLQSVAKITDCRITRRTGSVNKRGIYTETFNFVGILFRDDQGDVTGTSSGLSGTDVV
jgi:hypothetical protein